MQSRCGKMGAIKIFAQRYVTFCKKKSNSEIIFLGMHSRKTLKMCTYLQQT